jgi:monoamine oxidase
VVVGGEGWPGWSARRIQAAGHSVVIVEAGTGSAGARWLTRSTASPSRSAASGSARQDRINALIAELGLVTHPTYDNGASVFELGGTARCRRATTRR